MMQISILFTKKEVREMKFNISCLTRCIILQQQGDQPRSDNHLVCVHAYTSLQIANVLRDT